MAQLEPMDVDDIDHGFDNKENSFHHNVLKNIYTEKGYEELDVSELNMKLRYSVTPASSPLSKSCLVNNSSLKNSDSDIIHNNTLTNENITNHLTDSCSLSKDVTISILSEAPHEFTMSSASESRNEFTLRPLDNSITAESNNLGHCTSDSNDNIQIPSLLSLTHTSEATTPTKEAPKPEGSPIMRGLKSVLNMFRPSQSPIPTESDNKIENEAHINPLSPALVDSITQSNSVLASTPISTSNKREVQIKRNSPHKDSVVFNDDLEKELLWKDETTIIFSKEKIPIHKLFFQQGKPLADIANVNTQNANESLDSTVEYMDISNNNSTIQNKTAPDTSAAENDHDLLESDSEFQDCEVTFTKNESQILEECVNIDLIESIKNNIKIEVIDNILPDSELNILKESSVASPLVCQAEVSVDNFTCESQSENEILNNIAKPPLNNSNTLEQKNESTVQKSQNDFKNKIKENNDVTMTKLDKNSIITIDHDLAQVYNKQTAESNFDSLSVNIQQVEIQQIQIPICNEHSQVLSHDTVSVFNDKNYSGSVQVSNIQNNIKTHNKNGNIILENENRPINIAPTAVLSCNQFSEVLDESIKTIEQTSVACKSDNNCECESIDALNSSTDAITRIINRNKGMQFKRENQTVNDNISREDFIEHNTKDMLLSNDLSTEEQHEVASNNMQNQTLHNIHIVNTSCVINNCKLGKNNLGQEYCSAVNFEGANETEIPKKEGEDQLEEIVNTFQVIVNLNKNDTTIMSHLNNPEALDEREHVADLALTNLKKIENDDEFVNNELIQHQLGPVLESSPGINKTNVQNSSDAQNYGETESDILTANNHIDPNTNNTTTDSNNIIPFISSSLTSTNTNDLQTMPKIDAVDNPSSLSNSNIENEYQHILKSSNNEKEIKKQINKVIVTPKEVIEAQNTNTNEVKSTTMEYSNHPGIGDQREENKNQLSDNPRTTVANSFSEETVIINMDNLNSIISRSEEAVVPSPVSFINGEDKSHELKDIVSANSEVKLGGTLLVNNSHYLQVNIINNDKNSHLEDINLKGTNNINNISSAKCFDYESVSLNNLSDGNTDQDTNNTEVDCKNIDDTCIIHLGDSDLKIANNFKIISPSKYSDSKNVPKAKSLDDNSVNKTNDWEVNFADTNKNATEMHLNSSISKDTNKSNNIGITEFSKDLNSKDAYISLNKSSDEYNVKNTDNLKINCKNIDENINKIHLEDLVSNNTNDINRITLYQSSESKDVFLNELLDECKINDVSFKVNCEDVGKDTIVIKTKDFNLKDIIEDLPTKTSNCSITTSQKSEKSIDSKQVDKVNFKKNNSTTTKEINASLDLYITNTSKNVFNLPEIHDINFNSTLLKGQSSQSSIDTTNNSKLFDYPDINSSTNNQTVVASHSLHDLTACYADEKENIADASVTTCSSTTDKDTTVCEIHTDNEDTIEGPFLEAEDNIDTDRLSDFGNESDLMQFSELPVPEQVEAGELFIDAETYDFLMNKNNDDISEHGKESLFLKFDPLYARKVTSDGVITALSEFKRRQSTPRKRLKTPEKGLEDKEKTCEKIPFSHDSVVDVTHLVDCNSIAEDSYADFNISSCKPTMAVSPAVHSVQTPNNTSSVSNRMNRRSLTLTSPAMTVIDKLLSLSPSNNSLTTNETTVSSEQNEATQALINLREVLSEKVLVNQQLKIQSKELQDRLTSLESQINLLQEGRDDRLTKIKVLDEQLIDKTKINKSMANIVEEYEKTIATLIAETEQEKKLHAEDRIKLVTERNEQTAHLASMEVSFNDLYNKFEKSKQLILTYKTSEETYKKSLKDFNESCTKLETNYDLLKQHATSKLNHANEELEKIRKAHKGEVLKLNAMIKRKDLYITSLEESLAQKTKANEELTAICDELINKVG